MSSVLETQVVAGESWLTVTRRRYELRSDVLVPITPAFDVSDEAMLLIAAFSSGPTDAVPRACSRWPWPACRSGSPHWAGPGEAGALEMMIGIRGARCVELELPLVPVGTPISASEAKLQRRLYEPSHDGRECGTR